VILHRAAFLFLALISVTACAQTRQIDWTEDVRLSDGRTIVVKRTGEYRRVTDAGAGFRQGWLLERSGLSAELPAPISRSVSWQGSLEPVVLDVHSGAIVYLVGVPANGRARHEWKLPRHELYAVLRLGTDGWERISIDQLPTSMQPNLFVSADELFLKKRKASGAHVDLKLKAELDSDSQIDKRYKTIIRLPLPQPK
jgi:hypothetical protein